MRLLILGVSGQLGYRVAEEAVSRGHDVAGTYWSHAPHSPDAFPLDIRDAHQVRKAIERTRPDWLVNSAAMTNLQRCEEEKDAARAVNVDSVGEMAKAVRSLPTRILQISTDFVFDGNRGDYMEEDSKGPVNYYGWTKSESEECLLRMAGPEKFLVARSGGFIDFQENTRNVGRVLFEALRDRRPTEVIADQITTFTHTLEVSKMLLDLVERGLQGTYHVGGEQPLSRFQLALAMQKAAGVETELFRPISMRAFSGWRVPRPAKSYLNVSKMVKLLKSRPVPISEVLRFYMPNISD